MACVGCCRVRAHAFHRQSVTSSSATGFLGATGHFLETAPLPHQYGPEGTRLGASTARTAETEGPPPVWVAGGNDCCAAAPCTCTLQVTSPSDVDEV